jgi:hypothetical protein
VPRDPRFHKSRPVFSPMSLNLPPLEIVMGLLRSKKSMRRSIPTAWISALMQASDKFSFLFTMCYPFLTLEKLNNLLKLAYLSIEDYPLSTAILVHGGLYYLFLEDCVLEKQAGRTPQFQEQLLLCKENLETCLDCIELLLPATDENVYALLMGVGLL